VPGGKHGKVALGNEESQRKEERCGSMRKIVGLWTNCVQGVRKWINLIHLRLVG
jgi:hypothetical protein